MNISTCGRLRPGERLAYSPRMSSRVCVLALVLVHWTSTAMVRLEARFLRMEVERVDTVYDESFSRVGPYERVVGKAFFAVNPQLPANGTIVDLDKSPVNQRGLVEFSADVIIARPRDPSRANGAVIFEVANRGSTGNMGFFNRAGGLSDNRPTPEFADGFLLEQGYTLAWLGWQFDVPDGRLRAYLPVAKGVTGLVRSEITVETKATVQSLADRNHKAYPMLNAEDPSLELTVRDRALGRRQTIPRSEWQVVDGTSVQLASGFVPGRLYELIYTSSDPPIAGLGAAGIRDLISHLKHEDQGRSIERAYAFGQSQSGRYLRNFIYDGFNADEDRRIVFDGLLVHVAGAGRGSFNLRFAQPSRDGAPFFNLFYPTDIFPFTDWKQTDPKTGRTDGLLARAIDAGVVPKIFYMNSSYEYYGRGASLIHTTLDGSEDMPLPPTTRVYLFSAGQHGPSPYPPRDADTQYLHNPNPSTWCLRALLVAMDAWVRDGVEPPPSQYPRLDNGQLTPLATMRFPVIPGVQLPVRLQTGYRVDYGPDFVSRGIITIEPPKIGAPFPIFVPQVDEDGNDIAGIRMPSIKVPLATYTGWNLRAPALGAPDELAHLIGSYFPFARTKAEGEKTGDPRASVHERYASRQEYLKKVRAAARDLVTRRYLLERDVPRVMEYAETEWDYVTSGR